MKKPLIAPSILSADFARLGEECRAVLDAGADMIHFDVMDNHYVPNLTIGPMVLKSLRDYGITAPIDVHLMTKPVDNLIIEFANAGADFITIHPEATEQLNHSLNLIKRFGAKVGLAFNPTTPLNHLKYLKKELDLVLIMSVNPGFGGQKFIPHVLDKIREARMLLDLNNAHSRLEVDGGITVDNIGDIAQAGADAFVAGSAIFNSDDYKVTIDNMRKQVETYANNP